MINQIEEETGSLPPNLPRGVPPETAAANPDVQAIIAPRLTMLMEIANSFLVTIIDSLESVPYGIRWICKQIRSLTRVSQLSMFDFFGSWRDFFSHRESTLKRRTTRFALSSVAFSSFASSIRRSSLLKHICS
jgi:hypothetical protein